MYFTTADITIMNAESVKSYHQTLHDLMQSGWTNEQIDALIVKPVDWRDALTPHPYSFARGLGDGAFGARRDHRAGHGWKAGHQN